MSIKLDGNYFDTFQTNYVRAQSKFADTQRGLTGLPLRVESGAFENRYTPTLVVTTADIANLRTSLAKVTTTGTPPANLLDFIDEEGNEWNPAGSGSGNLNTGVYFTAMTDPRPLTPTGWTARNRFTVQVTLIVNSTNLST